MKPYTPIPGSLAYKVIEFLTTHPDESLTANDISAKFDSPARGVHSCLGVAVESQVLKRVENDDGEIEYSLHKGTSSIQANPGAHPSLGSARASAASPFGAVATTPFTTQPKRRSPRVRLAIDLDAVKIETGVPVAVVGSRPAVNDWPALFARLKPGQSCLLPKAVKASLAKIAGHWKKQGLGELAIRAEGADQIRLHRVA